MNMNDFFAMGFCKVAEEHGVDPVQLAKYAGEKEILDFLGPTVSKPSDVDLELIRGLNTNALTRAAQGLTIGSYLKNMMTVDPKLAHYWAGMINRRGPNADATFKTPLADMIKDYWGDVVTGDVQAKMPEDPLLERGMQGHYANVTNMAARAGLWDPNKNAPTLAGYGLEPPATNPEPTKAVAPAKK